MSDLILFVLGLVITMVTIAAVLLVGGLDPKEAPGKDPRGGTDAN